MLLHSVSHMANKASLPGNPPQTTINSRQNNNYLKTPESGPKWADSRGVINVWKKGMAWGNFPFLRAT